MLSRTYLITILATGAGLALGLTLARQDQSDQTSSGLASTSQNRASERPGRSGSNKSSTNHEISPSSDTLKSIKDAGPKILYRRLSHWLIDASPEEISSYWQHHLEQTDPPLPILSSLNCL